jgi:hypothetical protein
MLYKDKYKIIPVPKLYTIMVNTVRGDDAWSQCYVALSGHLRAPADLPLSKDSDLIIKYKSEYVSEWY